MTDDVTITVKSVDSGGSGWRSEARLQLAVLLAVWLITTAISVVWLDRDQPLYPWDMGSHQIQALAFHDERGAGQAGLGRIRSVSYYYPPGYYFIGSLFLSLTGRHPDTLAWTNLLYVLLAMIGTWLLGGQLYNRRAGFLAALSLALYPGIVAYSRTPFIDIFLTAVVVWTLYLLAKLAPLANRSGRMSPREAVLLGIVLGGGLLIKWTFAFFLLAPVIWLIVVEFTKPVTHAVSGTGERTPRRKSVTSLFFHIIMIAGDILVVTLIVLGLLHIKNGVFPGLIASFFDWLGIHPVFHFLGCYLILLVVLCIRVVLLRYAWKSRWGSPGPICGLTSSVAASPWYHLLLVTLFCMMTMYVWYQYSFHLILAVFYEHAVLKGIIHGEPAIGSAASWLYYSRVLLHDHILAGGVMLFIFGLIRSFWPPRRQDVLLLTAVIVPYIIFSGLYNKDIRFTLPLLPVVALMSWSWVPAGNWRWWTRVASLTVLTLFIVQYAAMQDRLPLKNGELLVRTSLLNIPVFKRQIQFIGKPVTQSPVAVALVEKLGEMCQEPPLHNFFTQVPRRFQLSPAESRRVIIASNSWFLDQYSIRYWSRLMRQPITIGTIDGRSPLVFREALHSGFVLVKSGDSGEEARHGSMLGHLLNKPGNLLSARFHQAGSLPLADGSTVTIWVNNGRVFVDARDETADSAPADDYVYDDIKAFRD